MSFRWGYNSHWRSTSIKWSRWEKRVEGGGKEGGVYTRFRFGLKQVVWPSDRSAVADKCFTQRCVPMSGLQATWTQRRPSVSAEAEVRVTWSPGTLGEMYAANREQAERGCRKLIHRKLIDRWYSNVHSICIESTQAAGASLSLTGNIKLCERKSRFCIYGA